MLRGLGVSGAAFPASCGLRQPSTSCNQHCQDWRGHGEFGLQRSLWGSWLAAVAGVALRSHSRPQQTPHSQRERMLMRPEGSYNRKTGHKRSKKPQQHFLVSPTDPKTSSPERRSPRATELRLRLKKCYSSKLLLDLLQAACDAGSVDISIFSAAVQRCGQSRWWRPLQDVLQMQQKAQTKSDSVHVSSVLTALATCLRREGKFGVVAARAQAALKVGQEVVEEYQELVTTESDCNILLTAVFKLCSQIADAGSRQWALNIWEWSHAESFEKDDLTWAAFLTLSEQFGDESLVDRHFRNGLSHKASWIENPVLLGGLLNAAANRCSAARADAIWDNFCSAELRPNMICYSAYSKAHMMAGSPMRAVEIIDDMEMQKVATMNSNIAVNYGQCLLVVCHSSTSPSNRQKLLDFIARGDKIMAKDGRGNSKNEWQKINENAGKLLANAKSVQLQDLLSEWKARTLSVMKDWENCHADTKYLKLKAPAYSSEDDILESGSSMQKCAQKQRVWVRTAVQALQIRTSACLYRVSGPGASGVGASGSWDSGMRPRFGMTAAISRVSCKILDGGVDEAGYKKALNPTVRKQTLHL